jgi:hypothetical protein
MSTNITKKLTGKVALATDDSRGMGAAIANVWQRMGQM